MSAAARGWLFGGGSAGFSLPVPRQRRGFCPHALPPASQAAGKKLGPALQRRPRRVGRAVGAPGQGRGPAAPRVTRLLRRPLPRQRRQPSRRPRTLRTLGVGSGAGGVCRANPVQGRQPGAPRGVDSTLLAVGVTGGGPGARRGDPSLPAGPSGRPARSEVGRRKLSAGWGGAQLEEEGVKFREAAG